MNKYIDQNIIEGGVEQKKECKKDSRKKAEKKKILKIICYFHHFNLVFLVIINKFIQIRIRKYNSFIHILSWHFKNLVWDLNILIPEQNGSIRKLGRVGYESYERLLITNRSPGWLIKWRIKRRLNIRNLVLFLNNLVWKRMILIQKSEFLMSSSWF